MHILVIHPRFCIRALKQIEALLERGNIKISIILDSKHYGTRLTDYVKKHATIYSLRFHDNIYWNFRLTQLLKRITPDVDIIHCHNEPNYHLRVVLSKYKDKIPVVYDIHDLTSMRTNREEPDEAYAYRNADAVIHVSQGFIHYGDEKYGQQNSHAILSLPSKRHALIPRQQKTPKAPYRFVYQGGVIDSGFEKRTHTHYRDYSDIFRSILEEGHSLDVYSASGTSRLPKMQQLQKEFNHLSLHKPLPYSELLHALQGYDFGIIGFSFDYDISKETKKYLHAAMGNKLFDYVFAGIPSIVINADEMARFVIENRCGLVKKTETSWTETIEAADLEWDLKDVTETYCMEREVEKLIAIYTDIRH